MRAASLRHFLESLCFKSPWNYAVFWKLQHQCPTVLTLEDGYLDIPCAREPYRNLFGNYYRKNLNELSPNCGSRSHSGYLGAHPIGLTMVEMSSTYHVAGKGVIGEVASLGIPRWISSDNLAPADLSFGSAAECPDEWMLPFVTGGIKTILLVPCIPYGVLQLGSMETVAENVEMVTNLAEVFDAHFKFVDNFLPGGESSEFLLQSTLSESLNIPSTTTTNEVNEDDVAADIPILKDHKLAAAFPMTSLIEVQHPFQSGQHMQNVPENENESKIGKFVEHVPNVLENANESEIGLERADMTNLVKQLVHEYSDDNRSGLTESSFGRSCHAKDVDAFSYSSCNVGGVTVPNEVDFYFDGDMLDLQSLVVDCSDTILGNVSSSLSCPTECELYEALGSTIQNNLSSFTANTASRSIYTENCMFNIEPSFGESNEWHLKEDNAENLLEAIVASACCFSDDYSLPKMAGLESLYMPSGKPAPFCKRKNQSIESASVGDDTVTRSTLTSASAGADIYALTNCSQSASSFDCVVSAFNEGQHQTKVFSSMSCHKEPKISNTNKKRRRSDDTHKPRPRDRQLIQDRLKELRQLVPNGAKCSIDGLLDKTIKHMLFLRNVTDQADKLRYQAQTEVDKSLQSPEIKSSNQQGTCWALELGSADQICPIIVNDLEYPGHMLIEMMCDDHGRFLEISDVIHRLELTILKGVMEKRSENTWAHFIVEASGSFHRLDIFWPLMKLLQQVPRSVSRNV